MCVFNTLEIENFNFFKDLFLDLKFLKNVLETLVNKAFLVFIVRTEPIQFSPK